MDWSMPGSSVHCIFPLRILDGGCHFLLKRSSWPSVRYGTSALAGRFLTTEPPGSPDSLGYFILNSTWLRTWGKHWVGSSFALPAPERTILGWWSVLPHQRFVAVCRVAACPPLPSPDRHTPLHRREDTSFSL